MAPDGPQSYRAVLGPLTSTFTPSPSCLIPTVAYDSITQSSFVAFGAQECTLTSGLPAFFDNSRCWPPASTGAPSPSIPLYGWGFYSPGLMCPSGYTRACTAIGGIKSEWSVQFAMSAGETAVGCCPPGYTCGYLNGQTCIGSVTSGNAFPLATCSSGSLVNFATITLPYTISAAVTSAATISPYTCSTWNLLNPMIEIRWQSSDLPTITATSRIDTPTNIATGSFATSTETTSSKPKPALSSEARAGMGVGIGFTVVILALVGMGAMLWRRRLHKKRQSFNFRPTHDQSGPRDPEYYIKPEISGHGIYEIGDHHGRVSEMEATLNVPRKKYPTFFVNYERHELSTD